MKLFIFTAAFYDRDYDQKLEMLRATCRKFDLELYTYGKKQTFNFYGSKIVSMGVQLNNVKKDYTHALYTDCGDSMFLTGLEEIITKYQQMGSPPLVVSGEKTCFPFGDMASKFPESPSPWKYMNPGMYIGEIPTLLDVMSKCASFYQLQTNDQGHWYEAWNKYELPITVDENCQLFQTMSESNWDEEFALEEGRLVNKITGTRPCVVHFNGGKDEITVERMNKVFEYVTKEAV